jgi:hypothetical protein
MPDPQSNLPPKKKTKHVVASGKQHIIRVDVVDDVEAYNNYDEMPLLIDFCKKIDVVEKNLPKDVLPWERKCIKGKVIMAVVASLCRCVFVRLYLCMCVRLYLCMCVRLHSCMCVRLHSCMCV